MTDPIQKNFVSRVELSVSRTVEVSGPHFLTDKLWLYDAQEA